MTFSPFSVRTPASTANLGPGFDSIGLALPIFQTIDVEPGSSWSVSYDQQEFQHLPPDGSNLILKTIHKVARDAGMECPTAELYVRSDIPLSRGLGSSAAAIAAGVSIADRLMNLNLSIDEQIKAASEIEGHPDNVSASIAGGLTVSRYADHELTSISLPVEGFSVVIMAPENELETEKSRGVIPDTLKHHEAVLSSAAANVMVASLLVKDFRKAGQVMMKDGFHEPYRLNFFPQFEEIKEKSGDLGAFAVTISGAGPCIAVFAEDSASSCVSEQLTAMYPEFKVMQLKPVNQGTILNEYPSNRLSV
ncbi:homoserine kinase [Jeotgalibacillus salarius]|uniref:homoserine kinase n=1 Tax=Jeotgalibacillus salarius TaxID=546023 RepID=UPI00141A901E|nr:homoserine kinase [Jeotgalibacillus salarius]